MPFSLPRISSASRTFLLVIMVLGATCNSFWSKGSIRAKYLIGGAVFLPAPSGGAFAPPRTFWKHPGCRQHSRKAKLSAWGTERFSQAVMWSLHSPPPPPALHPSLGSRPCARMIRRSNPSKKVKVTVHSILIFYFNNLLICSLSWSCSSSSSSSSVNTHVTFDKVAATSSAPVAAQKNSRNNQKSPFEAPESSQKYLNRCLTVLSITSVPVRFHSSWLLPGTWQ